MLYSSSVNMEVKSTQAQVGASLLKLQLIWCAMGLSGCVVAARIDYRKLKKISPLLLAFAAFLLVLVYLPVIGIQSHGSHRWIGHGRIRFQPSELAKIALIIFIAYYGERYQRQMPLFRKGLVIPGAVIAVVLGLVFFERDVGCTILLALVTSAMLMIAGVRLSFIIPPAMVALAGLALFLWHDPMRSERIYSWLHLEETKLDKGLQAYQSVIALGAGGWTGLGLGNGRQKLDFVPEHHTDFIFSIIGEELGLIATLAVLLIFVVLVICGTMIARRSSDIFGLLLGSGITFLIGFQALINIGVVTSWLPNKGMPLPFISYGGSNLLILLIAIGLLLSVSRFAVEPEKRRKNPFEISTPQLSDA